MPRIIEIREIQFVEDTWQDPRGYPYEAVTDPIVIEHYRELFEQWRRKAPDQVRLCRELGHHETCGGIWEGNEGRCAYYARKVEEECWAPNRQRLVRITLPSTLTLPG